LADVTSEIAWLLDRDHRRDSNRDRGLEIYRLSDATATASQQDRHSRAGADAVIVDLVGN